MSGCFRVHFGLLFFLQAALAQDWYLRGKVTMEDGSPPPKPVMIERVCSQGNPIREALTDKRGNYFFRALGKDTLSAGDISVHTFGQGASAGMVSCVLRASLSGYFSNTIDLSGRRAIDDPNLPPLVLRTRAMEATFGAEASVGVPRAAHRAWSRAGKAAESRNWPEAERQLRIAVQAAPRFSHAWHMLGVVCQNRGNLAEARAAYRQAITARPNAPAPYLLLAPLDIGAKDWPAAIKTADGLLKLDARRRYPEAFLYKAIAQYHLGEWDVAEANAQQALRLDTRRRFPRAEYILGAILARKRDFDAAEAHMRRYLELEPKASDAEAVRVQIAGLRVPDTRRPDPIAMLPGGPVLPAAGEAWVPGGIAALSRAAHFAQPASPADFFLEYCRTVARRGGLPEDLRQYFAALAELERAGERQDGKTVVSLSLSTAAERSNAERILPLIGWRLEGGRLEPGDQPADGPRQRLPALLGVDEMGMVEALEAGRTFTFQIPSETARLVGGDSWSGLLYANQLLPGGLAEAFALDPRLAKTYAAVARMGAETATALAAGVGLRSLVERHSDVLFRCADAFAVQKGAAVVPGGVSAEKVWLELAGVSPRDPPAFFRALLETDKGNLAVFYQTLSGADQAHQRFFTASAARARRFYDWYANSAELQRDGAGKPRNTWCAALFRDLPLNPSGRVAFPGGRSAWTGEADDTDALLRLPWLEALPELARLERERQRPLDERSATLLARGFAECRRVYPYFAELSGLRDEDFKAFFAFVERVRGLDPAGRNLALGQWHAIVELIRLGRHSGFLDPARGAALFRLACSDTAPAVLRQMLSAGDADEQVRALLSLAPEHRAAFERVLELQHVPRLSAARSESDLLLALSGLLYAVWFRPDDLLIAEDPLLLRKHQFVDQGLPAGGGALFPLSELRVSNVPPGSYLSGGFAQVAEVARKMASGGDAASVSSVPAAAAESRPLPSGDAAIAVGEIFRADARLVEVHATLTDGKGRYLDGIPRERFTVFEDGRQQKLQAFESQNTEVSCALLLDTTGSMHAALPALKSAALKLIGELRANDSVAVYSFDHTVTALEPFTTDKRAARRAVLRAYPHGETALHDALARVSRDIAARSGKKVIVVLTDGADNASSLTVEAAVKRAKTVGAPVYAVAQGAALDYPVLLRQLEAVSAATGGLSFGIRNPAQIRGVFESVAADLKHGYLLAYQPAPAGDRSWRRIRVEVKGAKGVRIRAREGYYPE